ncbi:MAG: hypothetical protein BEN18_02545 [Epulopiscium sp. Nuni2H_MBin001]|nr:MAG: hypothetical protein BEN18_02545 [Epulopiscium sp. Nuni2H_MBin001]
MKCLLVSFNAKYIHSSLALRYIKEFCSEFDIDILELTINHDENQIIKSIYECKPDVIGFSCYIWNITYIKSIIPTIRKLLPNTKLILGGPEVSYNSRELLNELPIDILMEGEGEKTWKEYLQQEKKLCDIDGLIYKYNSQIIVNPPRKPMDMSELPFVYKDITDLKHKIIYYEASRGCPFSCQYCLSSVEAGVRFMPIERVYKDLDYFLSKNVPQVKFVDRTFNANKAFALNIWKYIINNDNGITNFHFEIAAELINNDMLEILSGARDGLIQFEIGVQSTNPKTLKSIMRPMPFEEIKKVSLSISKLGTIHQHLDLIVGLPFENYLSFRNSFNEVISIRPEQLQLGFLKVLKGSGLYHKASEFGIVYKDLPPYEVLYTNYITYDEIVLLHQVEEMLERYYNSNRFTTSLEYLFSLYNSEFDLFESLAKYWSLKQYDKVAHKKSAYYLLLLEFGQTVQNCNIELLKELIRWDWLCHENLKEVNTNLITIDQEIFKQDIHDKIKDDNWLACIDKQYITYEPKQRLRNIRIEYFKYNVKKFNLLDKPRATLFHYKYGANQADVTILMEEF